MSGSYYDVAQICQNGHVINSFAQDYPESNQTYCSDCGEETMTACPSCDANIRGYYHVPGVIGGEEYGAPSYCYNCGRPYPWTTRRIKAASELAEEFDSLTGKEIEILKSTLPNLMISGPETIVAESRFKKIMRKAGSEAYKEMRTILVDVVSESVRKSLFGP